MHPSESYLSGFSKRLSQSALVLPIPSPRRDAPARHQDAARGSFLMGIHLVALAMLLYGLGYLPELQLPKGSEGGQAGGG